MIPYSRQCIEEDDIAAVADALRGEWLTTGPHVAKFEEDLASCVEAEFAVTFSSGTAALHGALAAAGIGEGAVVATTPLSFSASANAARYVGADVRFVDIDVTTMNLDVSAIPQCDALVAVHYTGLPVDLSKLSSRPGVLIEDAAQALGAATPDGPVGNCARSDLTVFSFHPVKSITTGEGGAVTTNDRNLAERLRRFRSHGIVPTPENGGWSYDIVELGYNYRLTDLQAALGTSQLRKLTRFVDRRRELADRYRDGLGQLPLRLPPETPEGFRHAHHLFVVAVPDRRRVYDELRARGVGVQVHHMPIHRLSVYERYRVPLPRVESLYEELLSLPLHPLLTEEEQDHVIASIQDVLR